MIEVEHSDGTTVISSGGSVEYTTKNSFITAIVYGVIGAFLVTCLLFAFVAVVIALVVMFCYVVWKVSTEVPSLIRPWLGLWKLRMKLWWRKHGSNDAHLWLLWMSDPGAIMLGTCWTMPYNLWELSLMIKHPIEDGGKEDVGTEE